MRRTGLLLAWALLSAPIAQAADLTVFAAASTKTALEAVAAKWRVQSGHEIALSFAGSSALARQIQNGAPADLFLSASPDWMDVLEREGLIIPGTRRDLLGNDLVLVAHGADHPALPLSDLPAALAETRLAMALVDAVPAGQYGKAALTSLGLWEAVAPRVAQTDNVRSALALVAFGEAGFGLVYATDARASADVSVVARIDGDLHPPITYPIAAIEGGDTKAARAFLAYLTTPAVRDVLTGYGFKALP